MGPYLRDAGFHALVLCALPEEYKGLGRQSRLQPWGGLEEYDGLIVLRAPLDDDPSKLGQPSQAELWVAHDVAAQAATLITRGRRVLFTCMQGRNRSAFVAALTLARLTGRSGDDCAERVRSTRSAAIENTVLINPWFCKVLHDVRAK